MALTEAKPPTSDGTGESHFAVTCYMSTSSATPDTVDGLAWKNVVSRPMFLNIALISCLSDVTDMFDLTLE